MRPAIVSVAILCILPCLFSCSKNQQSNTEKGTANAGQPQPVTLASLDKRLLSAEADISLLQGELAVDQHNLPATISCTQSGADMAQTAMGAFPVACESVTPYLDGYKVKLRIDNIAFVEFDGVDIHVAYGDSFNLTADESSTAVILPGHAKYVTVTLSPAKSGDVKVIAVTLKFSKWRVYQ